jgi:hypothetical protein
MDRDNRNRRKWQRGVNFRSKKYARTIARVAAAFYADLAGFYAKFRTS